MYHRALMFSSKLASPEMQHTVHTPAPLPVSVSAPAARPVQSVSRRRRRASRGSSPRSTWCLRQPANMHCQRAANGAERSCDMYMKGSPWQVLRRICSHPRECPRHSSALVAGAASPTIAEGQAAWEHGRAQNTAANPEPWGPTDAGGLVTRVVAQLGGGVAAVGPVRHGVDAQVCRARPVEAERHSVPQLHAHLPCQQNRYYKTSIDWKQASGEAGQWKRNAAASPSCTHTCRKDTGKGCMCLEERGKSHAPHAARGSESAPRHSAAGTPAT